MLGCIPVSLVNQLQEGASFHDPIQIFINSIGKKLIETLTGS